jgi:sigma-B regulation protein RsbU (phosphoserine phosphatase)
MFRRFGNPLNKLPLQAVLTVPFIVQVIAVVGVVGYFSFKNGQETVNDLAFQLRGELTARILQKLQVTVEAPHIINQINTNSFLQGDINTVTGEGEHQLWQQARVFPATNLIYCAREREGAFLGVGRSDGRVGDVLAVVVANELTDRQLYYYDINTIGNRSSLRNKKNKTYDPRVRPWYKDAKAAGKPTWSKIYLDFDALLPTITAAMPVYNQTDGQLLGVCATDLILSEELNTFLKSLKIGKSGTAFIVDPSGLLIASSTKEPITVGSGENTQLLPALKSSNPLIQGTANYLFNSYRGFDNVESLQSDFSLNRKRQFLEVVRFKDERGLDWLVVLVIPEDDFMKQIHENNRTTVLLCVIALFIAIVIGLLTTKWITKPILKLNRAAKDVAKGEWNKAIELKRSDELGELSRSFSSMAYQLKDSFATLEQRVEERTLELAEANTYITELNHRLKEENLRMSAELDVVRRLQQMILPKSQELESIPELEIAGFMQPADEVGGDYYDIFYLDGVVTIGIGDITGHGLESGVLMVMTQTAVRTMGEIRESNPIRFLDTLNRTLYQNIQRMDSDRNLSLAILNYVDGRLSISGQHEETLVVRAEGTVERIDTIDLGFPIGLADEIADFISQVSIVLNPGDGIVLYTDGITEAMDSNLKQYGIERLCDLIGQNWWRAVEDIKTIIIDDLRQYIGTQKPFDDITLVILKRKLPL